MSHAYDAYVEKRATELFAGTIIYARDVAANYVKTASGQDLTKEASEQIAQSTLVPFVIKTLAGI